LPNSPIVQVTQFCPGVAGHEKTDLFQRRSRSVSEISDKVGDLVGSAKKDSEVIAELRAIEDEILGDAGAVRQLHTALLSVLLGYRARSAWSEMVRMFGVLPNELRATPVVIEQTALALNRVAESLEKQPNLDATQADALRARAKEHRSLALRRLEHLPKVFYTSETYGISGRIYKGRADAERAAGELLAAAGSLDRAIREYEAGLKADPRDYYPGINAITLRVLRGGPDDEKQIAGLVPVVRFAVERLPPSNDVKESYWRTATVFELACADRDWSAADAALARLLAIDTPEKFAWSTTAENLQLQSRARQSERDTREKLDGYVAELKRRAVG
jgi:tetratricopeptide (TPR) repeat protein